MTSRQHLPRTDSATDRRVGTVMPETQRGTVFSPHVS